jgi:hypothetical protein
MDCDKDVADIDKDVAVQVNQFMIFLAVSHNLGRRKYGEYEAKGR